MVRLLSKRAAVPFPHSRFSPFAALWTLDSAFLQFLTPPLPLPNSDILSSHLPLCPAQPYRLFRSPSSLLWTRQESYLKARHYPGIVPSRQSTLFWVSSSTEHTTCISNIQNSHPRRFLPWPRLADSRGLVLLLLRDPWNFLNPSYCIFFFKKKKKNLFPVVGV